MAHPRSTETRALDAGELELVEKTHHPAVQEVSDAELADLVKLVRERRDKAQAAANRRRREMRGKVDAKGARPSADDTGSRIKAEVLAMAVRRLNSELDRRRRIAAKADLADNARNALALKQAADGDSGAPQTRTASEGMRSSANARAHRILPSAKKGSVSQQTRNAQARRDSR